MKSGRQRLSGRKEGLGQDSLPSDFQLGLRTFPAEPQNLRTVGGRLGPADSQ